MKATQGCWHKYIFLALFSYIIKIVTHKISVYFVQQNMKLEAFTVFNYSCRNLHKKNQLVYTGFTKVHQAVHQ